MKAGMTSSGLPSNLQHDFTRVPAVTHPRSTFDRSSARKFTMDPSVVVPIYNDQVYPGDTHQVKANIFARLTSPLKFPIMDNLFLDWFAFFVPYRLLWTSFINMMGEQANPGDPIPTAYTIPIVTLNGLTLALHTLPDYFSHIGVNLVGTTHTNVSAFKYRAYNKIVYDWFKDQNLLNSPVLNVGNGPDALTNYPLWTRRKRMDFFTGMLPFAQKWSPVTISGGTANVTFPSANIRTDNTVLDNSSNSRTMALNTGTPNALGYTPGGASTGNITNGFQFNQNLITGGTATLTSISINALRLAITTQQLYEIDARSGTRYIESNLAHFGVVSPDARLQRSEYLGGGTLPINIHPVAQTSGTGISGSTAQGTLTAFSSISGNVQFTQSFTEHGLIMVLAEIRADLTYWQGIPHEDFAEHSRYDLYFPVFANIGEQPYQNAEIYSDGSANDTLVFGYQEPFAHLRYKPSVIQGYFRHDATGSLDFMHLSQVFGSLPTLNSTFISENVPVSRVVTSASSPFFIVDSWWMTRSTRVLPVFGVPGLDRL